MWTYFVNGPLLAGAGAVLFVCRADWAVLNAVVGLDLVCHSRHNMNALFHRQRQQRQSARVADSKAEGG